MGLPKYKKLEKDKLNSDMARNIAHEINSPLATILLNAEMIQEETKAKKDLGTILKNATRIINSVNKISKIIQAIRAYSLNEFKKPFEEAEVSKIINEATLDFKEIAYKDKIDINVLPYDTDLMITCRRSEIVQIISNLLRNSIDAIAEQDEKWIEIKVTPDNDKIHIIVTDSGPPISQEVRESLFEPLFSTKNGYGMGIGLALCSLIAHSHSGDLYFNTESQATQFILILPIQQCGLFSGDNRGSDEE